MVGRSRSCHPVFSTMIRSVVFAALAMGLASCAGLRDRGPLIDPSAGDLETFLQKSDRALVVFSVRRDHRSNLFGQIIWDGGSRFSYRPGEASSGIRFSDFRTAGNYVTVALVSAGRWSLNRVDIAPETRYPIEPWDRAIGKPVAFGFTVAPGDVVYLGRVDFRVSPPPRTALLFTIENHVDEVPEALAEIVPAHAESIRRLLKTRIGTVAPRY